MKPLSEIIKEGEDLAEIENPPTLSVMKNLNQIVEEFLKKKELVIYGGTAIKALLQAKNVEVSSPDLLIDYDFFSPRYDEDSKALADEIYEKKYKYVRRINAIHPNTFRVGAEFGKQFIADITFFPKEYFGILQKNSPKIDGLRYTDPQFLKIDLYLSVTRPNFNVFRWKKSYKRLYYIEQEYPLRVDSNILSKIINRGISKKQSNKVSEIIQTIKKPIILLTGISAYNSYTGLVDKNYQINEDYLEVYTMDAKKVVKEVQSKLSKVEIREIPNFIDILPTRTEILENGKLRAIVYDIGLDCVSFHTEKGNNVVNYYFLLWYLYAFRYIEGIFKKNDEVLTKYTNMIINLQNSEIEYLAKNKKSNLLDRKNPFRIFDTDCLSPDPEAFSLQAAKRMFYGEKVPPGYRPDKAKVL